jgi:hypothetical protein
MRRDDSGTGEWDSEADRGELRSQEVVGVGSWSAKKC